MSSINRLHDEDESPGAERENYTRDQSVRDTGDGMNAIDEAAPPSYAATTPVEEVTRAVRPSKAMADLFAVIEGAMEPINKAMAPINRAMRPIREATRPIEQATRAIRRVMFSSDVARILRRVHEGAQRLRVLPVRVTAALLDVGFPPPFLAAVSIGDLNNFAEVYEQQGAAAAAVEIEALCSEILTDTELREELLARWEKNPYAAPCIDALRDVVAAHQAGFYYVTIPAVFAQLEGYIARRFGHTGWLTGSKLDSFIAALKEEGDELFGAVFADIMRTVRENFVHGGAVPPLSRHAVLHGADTAYGSKFNSLLVIALFDYVQELLSDEDDLDAAPP